MLAETTRCFGKTKMTVTNKRLSTLATATLLFVGGCTAEPQDRALMPNSTASVSARDASRSQTEITSETGATAEAPMSVQQIALAVDGEGIRFFNSTTSAATPYPFGSPRSEVLATLERVRGPGGKGTNESCGAGPVQYANWPDGLSLVFQRDRFVGWGLDGRAAGALSTASGIGIGSTREALDAAYGDVDVAETTLGDEFSAGGLFGLLDGPNAASKINNMWAGVNCVAR